MASRFAQVVDGVVTLVFRHQTGGLIEDVTDTVSAGWTYDGEAFAPPAAPLPERGGTISRTQAFLALWENGDGVITEQQAIDAVARVALPTQILTAIDELPTAAQGAARIRAWGAETISWNDPLLTVFAAAFSLDAAAVASLWDKAQSL